MQKKPKNGAKSKLSPFLQKKMSEKKPVKKMRGGGMAKGTKKYAKGGAVKKKVKKKAKGGASKKRR